MRPLELAGRQFGRLVVLSETDEGQGRRRRWLCACSCGATKLAARGDLLDGNTNSCGCLRRENSAAMATTHGKRDTPEWRAWQSMRVRCLSKAPASRRTYLDRGIRVCDRWDFFETFLADMGPMPEAGLTIDRLDNDKGYEPGNCRWATVTAQANNKRNNRHLTFRGETKTVAEWSRETGLPQYVIHLRLKYGRSIEETLTTPRGGLKSRMHEPANVAKRVEAMRASPLVKQQRRDAAAKGRGVILANAAARKAQSAA